MTRDFAACLNGFLSVVSFFSFLLRFGGLFVVDTNIDVSTVVLYFPKQLAVGVVAVLLRGALIPAGKRCDCRGALSMVKIGVR